MKDFNHCPLLWPFCWSSKILCCVKLWIKVDEIQESFPYLPNEIFSWKFFCVYKFCFLWWEKKCFVVFERFCLNFNLKSTKVLHFFNFKKDIKFSTCQPIGEVQQKYFLVLHIFLNNFEQHQIITDKSFKSKNSWLPSLSPQKSHYFLWGHDNDS